MSIYNVKIREVVPVYGNRVILHKGYGLDKTTELKPRENVVCYDSLDRVVWKINGDLKYWDDRADSFVGVSFTSGELRVISFSGNVYIVDIITGEAFWHEFVK